MCCIDWKTGVFEHKPAVCLEHITEHLVCRQQNCQYRHPTKPSKIGTILAEAKKFVSWVDNDSTITWWVGDTKENHGLDQTDVSKLKNQLYIQHTMSLFVEISNTMPQHQNKQGSSNSTNNAHNAITTLSPSTMHKLVAYKKYHSSWIQQDPRNQHIDQPLLPSQGAKSMPAEMQPILRLQKIVSCKLDQGYIVR